MSKFVTKDYTNKKEILKFPDHYVAVAVTVDDTGIVADADGKKIVSAGTIVGGGTLLNEATKVKQHVAASLTTALGGANDDLVFTAKVDKAISIEYVDPGQASQSLIVSISAGVISVSLATDGASAITSTATEIKAAIEAHLITRDLVEVSLATGNDGTGVVTAMVAAPLANGVSAEGVLLNDVNVTYGAASGAMCIHGYLDRTKVEAVQAISAQAEAVLKNIAFIK